MRILPLSLAACSVMTGCALQTTVQSLAPGDPNCPAGGVAVGSWGSTGYACNGSAGASVSATSLSFGDLNCPAGGSSFTTGGQTTFVCGAPAYSGINGVSLSGAQLSFDTAFGDARYAAKATDAGGPRVSALNVLIGGPSTVLQLVFDKAVASGTLVSGAFSVTTRDQSSGSNPWVTQAITSTIATMVGPNPAAELTLSSTIPAGNVIRVIAFGTGPKPLTGSTDIPLAGAVGGPPGSTAQGVDYVGTTVL